MAGSPQDMRAHMENKNVAGGQLRFFSKNPPTGFFRDGFCRTGPEDKGNHAIAAEVTSDFLDYSASKGNNLKDVGVKSGMKWCLCAQRWAEAYDAWQNGKLSKEAVPKVWIASTHESALQKVSYKQLKEFAQDQEAAGSSQRQSGHHNPESPHGVGKESKEIGGDMGTTAPAPS